MSGANVGPAGGGAGGGGFKVPANNQQMQKLRKFVLGELAAGTSSRELLPMVLLAKKMMKPGRSLGSQNGVQFEAGPGVKVGKREMRAVALAKQYLGTPYVWGGTKPGGFDCSGLLQYVYAKMGIKIPRVTYDQVKAGHGVPKGKLRPGDAVFFGTRGNVHHVGMYIGGGKFIEAPFTGARVRISLLKGRSDFVAARRYV
jgi:cell wall-associated NlpC family hydrolase